MLCGNLFPESWAWYHPVPRVEKASMAVEGSILLSLGKLTVDRAEYMDAQVVPYRALREEELW